MQWFAKFTPIRHQNIFGESLCTKVLSFLEWASSLGTDSWCEWPLTNGFECLSGLSLGDYGRKDCSHLLLGILLFYLWSPWSQQAGLPEFVLSAQQPPPHVKQTCTSEEWGRGKGGRGERMRVRERVGTCGRQRENLGFCI